MANVIACVFEQHFQHLEQPYTVGTDVREPRLVLEAEVVQPDRVHSAGQGYVQLSAELAGLQPPPPERTTEAGLRAPR